MRLLLNRSTFLHRYFVSAKLRNCICISMYTLIYELYKRPIYFYSINIQIIECNCDIEGVIETKNTIALVKCKVSSKASLKASITRKPKNLCSCNP